MIRNIQIQIKEAFCDDCKKDLHTRDGWGYVQDGDEKHYCYDCAVKRGLLEPLEWINLHGCCLKWDHADYKDGVVTGYIRCGKGFRRYEWEV